LVPAENSWAKSIFSLFHLKQQEARHSSAFQCFLKDSVRVPDYLFITVVNEICKKMKNAEKKLFHELTFCREEIHMELK